VPYATTGELLSAATRLAGDWGDAQVGFDHAAVAVLQETLSAVDGHGPEMLRVAAAISASREGNAGSSQFGSHGSARALTISVELRQRLDILATDKPTTTGDWLGWVQAGLAGSARPRLRTLAPSVEMILTGISPADEETDRLPVVPYTIDLTSLAADGLLSPVYGREAEIGAVIRTLGRRSKNHPVLIGPPGVGKTAIVELLATRIVSGQVPRRLRRYRVLQLDLGQLLAGSRYRGDLEERLLQLLKALDRSPMPLLLFVDEVHLLVGAGLSEGSPVDLGNLLKPALARSAIRLIGATTDLEYEEHVRRDPALERRLHPIAVHEPPLADTVRILGHLRSAFEGHHGIAVPPRIIRRAALMSAHLLPHRYQPDKAIDLVDEACSLRAGRAGDHGPGDEELMLADLFEVARTWRPGATREGPRSTRPLPASVDGFFVHAITQALAEASLADDPEPIAAEIRGPADPAAIEAALRAELGDIVDVTRPGVAARTRPAGDEPAAFVTIVDVAAGETDDAGQATDPTAQHGPRIVVFIGSRPPRPGLAPVALAFDVATSEGAGGAELAVLRRSVRMLGDGADRVRLTDDAIETAGVWLGEHQPDERGPALRDLQAAIASVVLTHGPRLRQDEDLVVSLVRLGTTLVPRAQRVAMGRAGADRDGRQLEDRER
jgi:hypothetical protein